MGKVVLEQNLGKEVWKRKLMILGFAVVPILIVVLLALFLFAPDRQLIVGAEIESLLLSDAGDEMFVKLAGGINNGEIEAVKFVFRDVEGGEWIYETTEGVGNISVEFDSGFWFFKKPEFKGFYDYSISSSALGIESFEEIEEVGVVFVYKKDGEELDSDELDSEDLGGDGSSSSSSSSGSSGGGGGGGGSSSSSSSGSSSGGCTPDCAGKECGDDGCGGSCGECNSTSYCEAGLCISLPACTDDANCTSLSGVCGVGKCNLTSEECYTEFNSSADLCRASEGECDVDDYCSGSSLICSDGFANSGISCSSGVCDGYGTCVECISDNDCSGEFFCVNGECKKVECRDYTECNDSNPETIDNCINPGLDSSYCVNNPIGDRWVYSESLERMTYVPEPNSPLAKAEHPRVRLNSTTLPLIRQKITDYYFEDYQDFVNFADVYYDHNLGLAFIYLIGPIDGITYKYTMEEYKNQAISKTMEYVSAELEEYETNPETYLIPFNAMSKDDAPMRAGLVYDWLFDELTEEQKIEIVRLFSIEHNYIVKKGIFSSDYFETRQPWNVGLFFYNDGYNDTVAKELVDEFFPLMLDGRWLDAENWCSRDNGGYSEMGGYMIYHQFSHIMQLYDWYIATGEDYNVKNTGLTEATFARFPEYIVYRILPSARPDSTKTRGYEWRIVKFGQVTTDNFHFDFWGFDDIFTLWGEPLKNFDMDVASLNRWILTNITKDSSGYEQYWVNQFIMGDRSVEPKSPSELNLPTSRWFEGGGTAIMRTGFTDENDSVISNIAPNYILEGHSQAAHGISGFTIDKYGPLALQLQAYVRGNSGRRNHMIFVNPEDGYSGFCQQKSYPPDVRTFVPGSEWDWGGMDKLEFHDEVDYLSMNYTKQYYWRYYSPSKRINHYSREFVYLKPDSNTDSDYVVVFDRIDGKMDNLIKRWEISSAYFPEVNGNLVENSEGEWVYEGDEIIIRNDISKNPYTGEIRDIRVEGDPYNSIVHPEVHGMLYVKTLLPNSFDIVVKGGPNITDPYNSIGHEFDKDNVSENKISVAQGDFNIAKKTTAGAIYTGTFWTDVISTTNVAKENFLHVMQTADSLDSSQNSSMVNTELIESLDGKMQGAFIESSSGQENAVVMFAKDIEILNSVDYNVNGVVGSSRHVIADLESGTYTVDINGEAQGVEVEDIRTNHYILKQAEPSGRLYFETDIEGDLVVSVSKNNSNGMINLPLEYLGMVKTPTQYGVDTEFNVLSDMQIAARDNNSFYASLSYGVGILTLPDEEPSMTLEDAPLANWTVPPFDIVGKEWADEYLDYIPIERRYNNLRLEGLCVAHDGRLLINYAKFYETTNSKRNSLCFVNTNFDKSSADGFYGSNKTDARLVEGYVTPAPNGDYFRGPYWGHSLANGAYVSRLTMPYDEETVLSFSNDNPEENWTRKDWYKDGEVIEYNGEKILLFSVFKGTPPWWYGGPYADHENDPDWDGTVNNSHNLPGDPRYDYADGSKGYHAYPYRVKLIGYNIETWEKVVDMDIGDYMLRGDRQKPESIAFIGDVLWLAETRADELSHPYSRPHVLHAFKMPGVKSGKEVFEAESQLLSESSGVLSGLIDFFKNLFGLIANFFANGNVTGNVVYEGNLTS